LRGAVDEPVDDLREDLRRHGEEERIDPFEPRRDFPAAQHDDEHGDAQADHERVAAPDALLGDALDLCERRGVDAHGHRLLRGRHDVLRFR
jgi:hypothetical protein